MTVIPTFLRFLLSFSLLVVPLRVSTQDLPTAGSRERNVKAFLEEEVVFDSYLFPPGPFPGVQWKNPDRVASLVGAIPLRVEYFDSSFQRVDRAKQTGRYGAVIRGTTSDGFELVRYVTLYCTQAEFDDYSPAAPLSFEPLSSFGASPDRWMLYESHRRRFSFGSLLLSPKSDPDAAVFLAGLAELDPRTNGSVTPRMMDRFWWTKFKAGSSATFHKIIPFPATASSGTILREKAAIASPFTNADAKSIRAVSREWTSRSKEPMVVCIAHRGTVVFHESFGTSADGQPVAPAAPMWMASITKLLTGVLVMQFVDRGLVELDAPIDRYLPELASARPCPLTIRMLLNHTAGLSWAGEWASDWEPSMENRVAHALPFLQTGTRFRYHRGGYALTSKILERILGETVPQLFQRMIFQPLEMRSAFADNTYGGLYCSALDLARFGHMLLQHGRSGTQTIITDSAFAAMLPIPLTLADGERARSWGVGTSALGGNGLSAFTFGHEAASGAIFRIDPVNDLVVVVARNRPGTDDATYKEFAGRFLQTVTAPIHRVPGSHRE